MSSVVDPSPSFLQDGNQTAATEFDTLSFLKYVPFIFTGNLSFPPKLNAFISCQILAFLFLSTATGIAQSV
jgi:hypothetical protein